LVHSSAEDPEVEISLTLEDAGGEIKTRLIAEFPRTGNSVTWKSLDVSATGERYGRVLDGIQMRNRPMTLNSQFSISAASKLAGERSIQARSHFHWPMAEILIEKLANSWYLRWSARNLALPTALNAQRRFRIESNGFGLPTLIDDLLNYDRHRFGDLEREFIELFPDVRSIALVQQPGYDSPVDQPDETLPLKPSPGKQIVFRLRQSNYDLPASQAAEGMLYVLGYLALLYLPDPPRVLLIEEPENGIHPHRVADIVRLLRRLIERHPSTQVVLTSHSPYLVDAFEPHEVTWCHRDPEDNRVRLTRLDTLPEVQRSLSVFSLGEIWTGELETPPAAAESR
ncbi:MAG: ATP-binding protein, partial [Planctomycetales bacterium]|nr:ATP-binding protein [Planctomycetales bacterium]